MGPEDIEQIILKGEGNQVEFKQEFPKNWEEFAETISAFANTYGGTIFLGVDDHGGIVAVKDPKVEESIYNCIRSYIEPPLEVGITRKEVRNQPILIVQVKGGNKPCTVRDKGPFVRAGKTDRIATRYELDEMYSKRSQSGSQL